MVAVFFFFFVFSCCWVDEVTTGVKAHLEGARERCRQSSGINKSGRQRVVVFAGTSEKGVEKFKSSERAYAVEARRFDFQIKKRQLLPGMYIFPAVCTRQLEIYFLAPTIHHAVLFFFFLSSIPLAVTFFSFFFFLKFVSSRVFFYFLVFVFWRLFLFLFLCVSVLLCMRSSGFNFQLARWTWNDKPISNLLQSIIIIITNNIFIKVQLQLDI